MSDGVRARPLATLPGLAPRHVHWLAAMLGCATVGDLAAHADGFARLRFRNFGAKSTAALLAAVLAAIAETPEGPA